MTAHTSNLTAKVNRVSLSPRILLGGASAVPLLDSAADEASDGARTFLGMIAGGLLAAPFAAEGQQARRVWRVGGRMSSLNRVGETDR